MEDFQLSQFRQAPTRGIKGCYLFFVFTIILYSGAICQTFFFLKNDSMFAADCYIGSTYSKYHVYKVKLFIIQLPTVFV